MLTCMGNDTIEFAPNVRHATRLGADFYLQPDVVAAAAALLGKVLVTQIGGQRTAGRISETEAYRAPDDRACHAYGNRRTARTELMFAPGGKAYIYLCYGLHHLFNVVTGPEGMAHAVLVRAIEPLENEEFMLLRRQLPPEKMGHAQVGTGPGAAAQALGLRTDLNGHDLSAPGAQLWIEDDGYRPGPEGIATGKRIGVDYAGECAHRPWRFWLRHSRYHK
jgi:DNA-3-methyladenine glycosylase